MPRPQGEVWKYFNSDCPSGQKRAGKKVSCMYCSKVYQIANATRMEQHLLLCKQCPEDIKAEFEKPIQFVSEELNWSEVEQEEEGDDEKEEGDDEKEEGDDEKEEASDDELVRRAKRPRAVKREPLEVEVPAARRRRASAGSAGGMLSDDELPALHVDAALARALYASAAPLTLLQSPHWRRALAGAGVHAPRADALRGDLLDAEHARISARAARLVRDASALALLAESWRDDGGKINIVVLTPEPVFYRSIRCAENAEDRRGDEILKVIAELGGEKVYAVVTDCDMEEVWSLINSKYPHVACVECISHALNLLCDEMMNVHIIKKTVQSATDILNFVKTNSGVLSEFEKLQIETCGSDRRSLKLPDKTKWNAGVWVLRFFEASRDVLESLARRSNKILNKNVRDLILNQQLWTRVEGALEALAPVAEALAHAGSARAALSEPAAYLARAAAALERRARAGGCFAAEERARLAAAVQRRARALRPAQLAANLLDPRYRGAHVADRVPEAAEYVAELAARLAGGDEEKASAALVSLAEFRTGTGYFGVSQSIWRPAEALPPAVWWRTFAPRQAVAGVAALVLAVPPAAPLPRAADAFAALPAAASEGALSMRRLDKLLYVRRNLRLMAAAAAAEEPDDDLKQVDIHSIFPANANPVSLENYSVIVVNNPLGDL